MTLSKGATFHTSPSPPTDDSPVLSIRHLAQRSPTGSQSSLTSLLFEKEDGAARSIEDFERTFSGARGKRQAHRRCSEYSVVQRLAAAPSPPLSNKGRDYKDLTWAFERSLDLDSGLGSSIGSETAKPNAARMGGLTSEEDGRLVEDLIQAKRVNEGSQTTQHGPGSESRSAIVQSISPLIPRTSQQPNLSRFARKRFDENILQPILAEDRFSSLHPLISTLHSRTNKSIKCLRDLEQSLIFEPLVSNIAGLKSYGTDADTSLRRSKRFAISRALYRSFGEFSVQLVLDTFHHLSETEQRRAADRPYDNGYFLDLVQQVGRLAAQVRAGRRAPPKPASETADVDAMESTADDEVTLEGGLGQTGQPAELVRWTNGEGISLRTNERYEAHPGIKRQRSNESLDDDAERSMGRRKKNAEPRNVELKCSDKSCDKVFRRRCDLAKHQKTHSRPFKCPYKDCKYSQEGLPGEKERDRHINDKHSANPRYFHCEFCTFQTKRDSNCKQHMEKKHGWAYERVKGNSKSNKTPQQTPQTPNISTPGASDFGTSSANDSDINFTPYTTSLDDFGSNAQPADPYARTLFSPAQSTGGAYGSHTPGLNPPSPQYDMGYREPLTENSGFDPYSTGLSYFDIPLDTAYRSGQGLNVTSSEPLHIGIEYHDEFSGHPAEPVLDHFQPQLRDPSISDYSPMVTDDDRFQSAHQVAHHQVGNSSNYFTGVPNLPSDDFPLFCPAGDHSTPSVAHDSQPYEPMELFGNMDSEYSDSQLGRYVNL